MTLGLGSIVKKLPFKLVSKVAIKGMTRETFVGAIKKALEKEKSLIREITNATKTHILKGEINTAGRAVGCHYQGALSNGTVRIRPNTTVTNGTNNMFKAFVDVKDANGNWIPKQQQSTFFPKN